MWKRIVIVSALGLLALAFVLLNDGHTSVQAAKPLPAPGGAAQTRINPFSDAWLAANHGLYDNIWTAEYEGRGQSPAVSGNAPDNFPHFEVLADQRMSNSSFNTEQNEFQIDINPTNSQYAIGTSNDYMATGVGIYRTSDGGQTWTTQDAPVGQAACCDPGVAYAYDGSVYVIILDTSPFATYIIHSTDNGQTWTTPTNVQTNDRPNIVVDNGISSPRRGTVYLTYTDENASNRVKGYKSTDTGLTWSSSFFIGDVISATGFEQGSQPRVASDGTVYVGYQQYNDINAGCGAGVQNAVAKSTDGGVTWSYTVIPVIQGGVCTPTQNGRGLFCYTATASFRSRSSPIMGVNPTNPQHVYMLYSGGELEDPYTCASLTGFHSDILFRTSTDGGATFSAPSKVNTDPSGKDQYYPWMSVTANGTIWAGWHDRREDPNNFRHRWYESYSTDEGATWHKLDGSLGNSPIAAVTSLPFNFIGDYAGLAAADDNVLPMWWDSRNKASGDPYTEVGLPSTYTPTPVGTVPPTGSPTQTATRTSTSVATNTPAQTATAIPSSTSTSTTAPTSTATATATTVPTSAITATSTACALTFSDVPADSTFYAFIRCLACRGIISGYDDGTFRPGNNITRGQIAKLVSNAAGFDEDPGPQVYEDVDSTSTFYQWINRLSNRGFMGGYPCGTVDAEPCNPPDNRPYFRTFANATRGQLAKIVSNAAGINSTPTGVFYTDVPLDNPFYTWVMRLTDLGVMSGYDCGGAGEPCDSENRPYFRPFANVTRGQASKIVANTFLPGCDTPSRR